MNPSVYRAFEAIWKAMTRDQQRELAKLLANPYLQEVEAEIAKVGPFEMPAIPPFLNRR